MFNPSLGGVGAAQGPKSTGVFGFGDGSQIGSMGSGTGFFGGNGLFGSSSAGGNGLLGNNLFGSGGPGLFGSGPSTSAFASNNGTSANAFASSNGPSINPFTSSNGMAANPFASQRSSNGAAGNPFASQGPFNFTANDVATGSFVSESSHFQRATPVTQATDMAPLGPKYHELGTPMNAYQQDCNPYPQEHSSHQQEYQTDPQVDSFPVRPPAARGFKGMIQKQRNMVCGISPELEGCMQQLDDCTAQCRQEVQKIADQCRQRGQKYTDKEFTSDARALFKNGQSPSNCALGHDPVASWGRASDRIFVKESKGSKSRKWVFDRAMHAEDFVPGPMGGENFLVTLAAIRTIGVEPKELIVAQDLAAGVYGIRFFKDGEWLYEILDDYLPMDQLGRPACSYALCDGEIEVWLALLEKAYAKIHGCYENALGSEAEALEDILGMGSHRIIFCCDFPIWGELWQHLKSKRKRGYAMIATCNSHCNNARQILSNGLVSGFCYPVGRLEMVDGECLVELHNPWSTGDWQGRWGQQSREFQNANAHARRTLAPATTGTKNFWMSIQDFCKHFTDIVEARNVSPYWQCSVSVSSTSCPCNPLISVTQTTQALFVLTQRDRRWKNQEAYEDSIGLRIYRCRVVAPQQNATGLKQNVSNPFKNIELVAQSELTLAGSAMVEIPRLEASALYIASVDAEGRSGNLILRMMTSCGAPVVRDLTGQERQYLMSVQPTAPRAMDRDDFSDEETLC